MPTGRGNCGAVALVDRFVLVVAGGYVFGTDLPTVEVLDVVGNDWHSV